MALCPTGLVSCFLEAKVLQQHFSAQKRGGKKESSMLNACLQLTASFVQQVLTEEPFIHQSGTSGDGEALRGAAKTIVGPPPSPLPPLILASSTGGLWKTVEVHPHGSVPTLLLQQHHHQRRPAGRFSGLIPQHHRRTHQSPTRQSPKFPALKPELNFSKPASEL